MATYAAARTLAALRTLAERLVDELDQPDPDTERALDLATALLGQPVEIEAG